MCNRRWRIEHAGVSTWVFDDDATMDQRLTPIVQRPWAEGARFSALHCHTHPEVQVPPWAEMLSHFHFSSFCRRALSAAAA